MSWTNHKSALKARLRKTAYRTRDLFWTQRLVLTPHYLAGFFSNFNQVMNILVHQDHYPRLKSIEVDWSVVEKVPEAHFCYGRPEDGNLWLHFFEQLPFEQTPNLNTLRTNSYVDYSITGIEAYDLYRSGSAWRYTYHQAYVRYIKLRPHISQMVEDFYSEQMAGKHCLGFHIRNALHSEHPGGGMPSLAEYIDKAKELIAKQTEGELVIFLAADVDEVVDRFSGAIDVPVVVQPNVQRASQSSKRQLQIDNPEPSVKLGRDVLIDCLLLAKCKSLVHTTSNVSTALGYINPQTEMICFGPRKA